MGWNPDSFGYNWQLPQIYKRSGIDYFVTQKMSVERHQPAPAEAVLVGVSGRLRSDPQRTSRTGYDERQSSSPTRLSRDCLQAGCPQSEAPGLTDMLDLFGVGRPWRRARRGIRAG